jgi:hypothetical protein
MKKIALALLCVFATGTAAAQTYACQFIMSAGMNKTPKSTWKVGEFNVFEPFFLTMSNGSIDPKSFGTGDMQLVMSPLDSKCSKSEYDNPKLGRIQFCADETSHLSFSDKTLNGGLAVMMGALQSTSDTIVDSVSVSRFKCQKVN